MYQTSQDGVLGGRQMALQPSRASACAHTEPGLLTGWIFSDSAIELDSFVPHATSSASHLATGKAVVPFFRPFRSFSPLFVRFRGGDGDQRVLGARPGGGG